MCVHLFQGPYHGNSNALLVACCPAVLALTQSQGLKLALVNGPRTAQFDLK